jgi:methylase of polypeptide subunit release factors
LQSIRLRKRLFGQFDTPPSIVKLITRLAINDCNERVLDPAAGDGIFVQGAYKRLLELGASPINARKQIVATEVDRETYARAKERLSGLKILNADLFETSLGKFDVIVGNPPYIEQRAIGRKSAIRDVVLSKQNKIKMSARAGIYAYFIAHGAKLLNEDGILCFVVSSSWLDSIWGIDLQKFILDNFMVRSIIAFARDVFDEAMVETVILLLKRSSSKSKRAENKVKFVLLKKEVDISRIVGYTENSGSCENDSVSVIVKRQADLHKIVHWSEVFREGLLHRKLLQNNLLVPLQDIADVEYHFKEGCYDFFILNEEKMRKWRIEEHYAKPVVSSPIGIETFDLKPGDVKERILLVGEAKNKLKSTRALAYIEYGERKKLKIKKGNMRGKDVIGYNNLPTFRSKRLWYSLGKSQPCPILVPAFVRNRFFAIRNDAKAYATANFYGIRPHNKEHILSMLAFFNSSLAAFIIELKARTSMGRGLLDIRSYILRSIQVPDFSRISPIYSAEIDVLFNRMCKATREGRKSEAERIKIELEDLLFDALGIKTEKETIVKSLEEVRLARNKHSVAETLVVADTF